MFEKFVWNMAFLYGAIVAGIALLTWGLTLVRAYLRKRTSDSRSSRPVEEPRVGASAPYHSRSRELDGYPAICATCGEETMLPFKPMSGRPVYCGSCYAHRRKRARR